MMAVIRLKDLAKLHVLVLHPPDADGRALLEQLKRIGCHADLVWPPEQAGVQNVDVIFVGLFFESKEQIREVMRKVERPGTTVICVVDYESPAMLELVLDINAISVITKPVRSFGTLTSLVVARSNWHQRNNDQERIAKLERKLNGQKIVAKAKAILMDIHGLTELNAYKTIRQQAMAKRIPIEDMAQAIINANDLLSSPNSSRYTRIS